MPLTPLAGGATLKVVRLVTRLVRRILPAGLALLLVSAPVAECFTPSAGAEMPCGAAMHHDASCDQAPSAAPCCEQARMQGSYGVLAARQHEASGSLFALLSPVIAAPWLSQVPDFQPSTIDTGPPHRSTRLHIVLSVFLI